MKITLRQLQVFVFTAKFQNISMAAKKVNITQAAASMSLSQLETLLDHQLFDRDGKRLILNDTGKRILNEANAILLKADEIELLAQAIDTDMTGHIRIGASTTIASYILPTYLNSFSTKHPNITFELLAYNTETCIKKLLNFEIDLAFVEGIYPHEKIKYQPWQSDQLTVCCHPNHPLTKKRKIKLEQLTQYPWILRESESGTQQVFSQHFKSILPDINKIIIMNNSQAIKNYIKVNQTCLSFLSNTIIKNDISSKLLATLSIDSVELNRHFYYVKHNSKLLSRASIQLLDIMGCYPNSSDS